MKKIIISLLVLAALGLGYYVVTTWIGNRLYRNPALTWGNGRIEATEINIAARLAGKVERIRVLEGDRVNGGQVLVVMQTNVLVADLAQAEAKKEQAKAEEASALAKIAVEQANLDKMNAELERSKVVTNNAEVRYNRYKSLLTKEATSQQHFETAETEWLAEKSKLASAIAAIKEVEAALKVAQANALGAKANILAADAEIDRIKADIDDSILKAPLAGRIQYRVAEPGEVLSAGGRALNMVDLTDVYMTFFLPDETAGKVRIGSDVRIVLDAAPKYPLPAKVTYVAAVAQFTPKTVETQVERQKLMFRIKAHIDRALLERYIDLVKTGLPGVAWVKIDPNAPWPDELEVSPEVRERAEKVRKEMIERGLLTPGDVIESETRKQADSRFKDEKVLLKKIENANKETLIDTEVKAARQIATTKKASEDASTKVAQKVNKARQAEVNKVVEERKAADNASLKAPAEGSGK